MASTKPRPRWFFLITPPWLSWHAFAVFAAWGMLWLGDWQFHRAEGGNALSWAYTFEWPIFTLFGVVFWAKTIIDEYRKSAPAVSNAPAVAGEPAPGADLPLSASGSGAASRARTDEDEDDDGRDDPELAAYNAYLARLNSRAATR